MARNCGTGAHYPKPDMRPLTIGHIPAILWGKPSGRLIIAVHGDQSSKTDTVIELLAGTAAQKGYQVLSFDLPGHGERTGGPERCNAQTCVPELQAVLAHARDIAEEQSLFACSLGATFSLMAYRAESFTRALFLSPVVDMRRLIENMMGWSGVTEGDLKAQREVPTPMGKTLYWDDYSYARANPVVTWPTPTAILRGERDNLSEHELITSFCRRFGAQLAVMPEGEHFFHTGRQLDFYRNWLEEQLGQAAIRKF